MGRMLPAMLVFILVGNARARSLSSDGRIGKVIDSQGIASIKPVLQSRWTLAEGDLLLKPGDWLRTDVRGANALHVRLGSQARLILGPGTLVEAVDGATVKLIRGELEVSAPEKAQVQLVAPGGKALVVSGTAVFRTRRNKLEKLDKEPNWLQGFKGTVTTESMGSLLANVEGRNVPLTVGYHKVTVDVRDQIARTVVEESFVNHTNGTLEGVFYFPLPQDASISGFAMWIGDRCVEADVVEKQRAREIYETILRERRDPGLLEWTGGNIFKARVYPIFGHSEKRIKITYTQVLPLKGGRCRYSYALQSELLRQHPLRELAIDVRVHSALPLKAIVCKTHEVRTDKTAHAGHVEFSAQEYTPDRDFEVEIEVDHRRSPVVLIPHERVEDGYFLLLLTPPDAGGDWERGVLPDGDPLDLIILADTSGSMDEAQRQVQDAFVAALLSSLGEKDTFNLATCDTECLWLAQKSIPATEANLTAARDFLAARLSLGWSNLDEALESVKGRLGPRTQVIYLGDGIVTTGDGDPVAFAKRVRRLHQGTPATFHAVSTGSSFEPVVMKAIASLGGGSVRRIEGGNGPQAVARELLSEVTQPALRDLRIEFRGLRTARVYPVELPNLPAGAQQIVLGRYLPEGRDQKGEVIVTGVRDGKRVQFRAPVTLKDAESGNSFIPRLWARLHLDVLLDQGRSTAVKEEIIALSEEYNIMTPYTSFLVLESDADRERFKVKQRFRMRDGEKFFAEGRDSANFELAQQQMKRAGNWRIGLRRRILRELAEMGRDPSMFQSRPGVAVWRDGGYPQDLSRRTRWLVSGKDELFVDSGARFGPGGAPYEETEDLRRSGDWKEDSPADELDADGELAELEPDAAEEPMVDAEMLGDEQPMFIEAAPEPKAALPEPKERQLAFGAPLSPAPSFTRGNGYYAGIRILRAPQWRHRPSMEPYRLPVDGPLDWIQPLFPILPGPPGPPVEREAQWTDEARKLADSLLRLDELKAMANGLEIDRRAEDYDTRTQAVNSRHEAHIFVSARSWLVRSSGELTQTLISWCHKDERGVLSRPFLLGRRATAIPLDRTPYSFFLSDSSLVSLAQSCRHYVPSIEDRGNGQLLLKLLRPGSPDNYQVRYLIDTGRKVMLRYEHWSQGKLTASTAFKDFVQAAGCWWARRVESRGADGKLTNAETLTIEELSLDELARSIAAELAIRKDAVLLDEPLPSLLKAKQAILDGKPTFDDQLVMLSHFARSQQWERVAEHFGHLKKLAAGKPGLEWVENAVLKLQRRNEELKQRVLQQANALAVRKKGDELFLANHLRSTASTVCQNNEMLTFLDFVRPVYARQPKRVGALREWERDRSQRLYNIGRQDEALKLMRNLAERYPSGSWFQSQYARWLVNTGEYDAAYQWIERVLSVEGRWWPAQEDDFRRQVVQFLENQGRLPQQARYLAQWVGRSPSRHEAYERYLSALIRTDQREKAYELMAQWMTIQDDTEKIGPAASARIIAAVSVALGNGHNIHRNRIGERWLEPLSAVVRKLALSRTHSQPANRAMSDWRFQRTDACRALRKEFTQVLRAQADTLEISRVWELVNWIWPNDPVVEAPLWKEIAARLEARWAEEKNPQSRSELGRSIVTILSGRVGVSEHLAFLRRRWREGPADHRMGHGIQLFDTLLRQPWSMEYEDEAFSLLYELSDESRGVTLLNTQVPALYRLSDWATRARYQAAMDAVEHKEELSRTELRALKTSRHRESRAALVERLRKEADGAKSEAQKRLLPWLNVERLYLEARLNNPAQDIAAECWEYVGAEPPTPEKPLEWHAALALSRYLQILEYLASRPKAGPALVKRLLAYLDRGLAANPDDPAWKQHKYWLLVVLDRPEEIEKALRAWIRPGEADTTWRLALGYLLAETNRIPKAIQQFEVIKAADELRPAEYRALADWYLVVARKEEHEQAQIRALMAMEEWQLSNYVDREQNRWRNRGTIPGELNPKVVRTFTALFRKSRRPQRHLWRLRRIYGHTKDFRLPECLSEGMIGHTAETVYPFLQQLQGVLNEMLDEAAADSVMAHLAKVRERAETTVDRRALDLLEVQVRRRAAEVKNQPGPHVAAALAAMQRAFKGDWEPGERRLMADLLASLGRITQGPLATEQLAQLRNLHRSEKPESYDRLHIAYAWARCLWSYSRLGDATDRLRAALEEYRHASGGTLPSTAQSVFSTLISYLESQEHYARGEKTLFAELERPANRQMEYWLKQRLYELYNNAIRNKAEVSLGSGQKLYKAVERKLWDELGTPNRNHCYRLVGILCSIYRTAQDTKLVGAPAALKTFAYGRLAEILGNQTSNYQSMVSTVANAIRRLSGAREGLAFLIERLEKEPSWFQYANQDGWRHHSWRLGKWRQQAGSIGDLEPRLLKIVTAELRRELETQQSRGHRMYWRHDRFWAEKADVFAQVAEDVWQEKRDSGAAAAYIAYYFHYGLNRTGRAADLLLEAYGRDILDEEGQARLVDYLHLEKRHQESIPILLKLMDWRPQQVQYRVELMHAYFRTGQEAKLRKLLAETDAYFHEKGQWNEHVISQLARSCLTNKLFGESVAYYKELIPLHQRSHPRRGIGNGTLSSYYTHLAQAYEGLGQTADAVEAAAGAIVSWGRTHRSRQTAISALQSVLRNSPDLDAYAETLDKQVAETGLENPTVRKALGQVYLDKRQYDKAIRHLALAAEVQPNDAETHRALVKAYDERKDKEGAIRQLLASARLSRRNIALYRDLGRRLGRLGRAPEAERAYTTIVEMQPTESESHTLLAEIRQGQNRWPEAIVHWQQVARIRALEPTGLEELAEAQLHQKRWGEARESIEALLHRAWPERFKGVHDRARAMLRQVEANEK